MNNIVTFETAKRLKEAEFPQPEPATGQHWYRQSGGIAYIDFVDSDGEVFALLNGEVKGCQNFESAIFAPTATDILRELGKDYELSFFEESWFVCEDSFAPCTEHENPAEACVLAWLKLREK